MLSIGYDISDGAVLYSLGSSDGLKGSGARGTLALDVAWMNATSSASLKSGGLGFGFILLAGHLRGLRYCLQP